MNNTVLDLHQFTQQNRCRIYGCLEKTYNSSGVCDSIHIWTRECRVCGCRFNFRFSPSVDYTYCDDCRPKDWLLVRLFKMFFY
jgi:hypothetical protein